MKWVAEGIFGFLFLFFVYQGLCHGGRTPNTRSDVAIQMQSNPVHNPEASE